MLSSHLPYLQVLADAVAPARAVRVATHWPFPQNPSRSRLGCGLGLIRASIRINGDNWAPTVKAGESTRPVNPISAPGEAAQQ
jgi:hypothetical protein